MVLTSTISPVKRGRNSNADIPELYAYINNFQQKTEPEFFEKNSIQKFGTWMESVKKRKHQELNELGGGGWAKRILKSFNKVDLPCTIFVIFTTGGIDFVGGFTLFKFL